MAVDTITRITKQTNPLTPDFFLDHLGYAAIAFTDTASAAALVQANKILIHSDQPFHLGIGGSGIVATTSMARFPLLSHPLVLNFTPGDYISAIRSGANSGTLYVAGVY